MFWAALLDSLLNLSVGLADKTLTGASRFSVFCFCDHPSVSDLKVLQIPPIEVLGWSLLLINSILGTYQVSGPNGTGLATEYCMSLPCSFACSTNRDSNAFCIFHSQADLQSAARPGCNGDVNTLPFSGDLVVQDQLDDSAAEVQSKLQCGSPLVLD